jgi:NAD(P)-dependent dehydrogenase (short-subunit alcohol dehydrogenase family)
MDYRNAFDLTGSVAVVTGGSSGIGFESAVALGSCGQRWSWRLEIEARWTRPLNV